MAKILPAFAAVLFLASVTYGNPVAVTENPAIAALKEGVDVIMALTNNADISDTVFSPKNANKIKQEVQKYTDEINKAQVPTKEELTAKFNEIVGNTFNTSIEAAMKNFRSKVDNAEEEATKVVVQVNGALTDMADGIRGLAESMVSLKLNFPKEYDIIDNALAEKINPKAAGFSLKKVEDELVAYTQTQLDNADVRKVAQNGLDALKDAVQKINKGIQAIDTLGLGEKAST